MAIRIDVIPVRDEFEGTELMVHHLALACSYFEATHDDTAKRARRLIKQKLNGAAQNAALAFVGEIMLADEEFEK